MEPILSVVIPTKNRYEYLIKTVQLISDLNLEGVEIVVQDNSDDNSLYSEKLSKIKNVSYFYSTNKMGQAENSSLAVSHCRGKYICYIGDDDLITPDILEIINYMEKNNYEASIFPVSRYYWDDVKFKKIKYKQFSFEKNYNKIFELNSKKELNRIMKSGGIGIGNLPKIYHGVVSKKIMDKILEITSSYFPGESPDMASAVSISLLIDKFVYVPIMPIVSGFGGKSAGGAGAAGKHKSKISEVKQLSANVEKEWDYRVPRIWLGSTIWCYSLIQSLTRMGYSNLVNKINFNKLYAHIIVFNNDCSKYIKIKNNFKTNWLKISYYVTILFIYRALNFAKNSIINKKSDDDLKISLEATISLTMDYNKKFYSILKK